MSETNPTRSELKRQAILQAARDAFQEHGVHNTSCLLYTSDAADE